MIACGNKFNTSRRESMISKLLLTCILATQFISGMSQEIIPSKGLEEQAEMAIPTHLYIILSKDVWQKSIQEKALLLGPENKQFIHLATDEQIPHIAEKFFKGIDYVVLKIETKKMLGRLVYETNPGGSNKYFHLYEGMVPLEAVVEVVNK